MVPDLIETVRADGTEFTPTESGWLDAIYKRYKNLIPKQFYARRDIGPAFRFVSAKKQPDRFVSPIGEPDRIASTGLKEGSTIFFNTDALAQFEPNAQFMGEMIGLMFHELVHHLGVEDTSGARPLDEFGGKVQKTLASRIREIPLGAYGISHGRIILIDGARTTWAYYVDPEVVIELNYGIQEAAFQHDWDSTVGTGLDPNLSYLKMPNFRVEAAHEGELTIATDYDYGYARHPDDVRLKGFARIRLNTRKDETGEVTLSRDPDHRAHASFELREHVPDSGESEVLSLVPGRQSLRGGETWRIRIQARLDPRFKPEAGSFRGLIRSPDLPRSGALDAREFRLSPTSVSPGPEGSLLLDFEFKVPVGSPARTYLFEAIDFKDLELSTDHRTFDFDLGQIELPLTFAPALEVQADSEPREIQLASRALYSKRGEIARTAGADVLEFNPFRERSLDATMELRFKNLGSSVRTIKLIGRLSAEGSPTLNRTMVFPLVSEGRDDFLLGYHEIKAEGDELVIKLPMFWSKYWNNMEHRSLQIDSVYVQDEDLREAMLPAPFLIRYSM